MDSARFDRLAMTIGRRTTRRAALRLLGAALGTALSMRARDDAGATHFGCRHWKEGCKRSEQCCSGICWRKKCRAHDTGGCRLADNFCAGGEDNRCQPGCLCNITTGKAPHCGSTVFCPAVECQRDADCGEPGAACIPHVNCQGCGNPATQNFCQRPCGS